MKMGIMLHDAQSKNEQMIKRDVYLANLKVKDDPSYSVGAGGIGALESELRSVALKHGAGSAEYTAVLAQHGIVKTDQSVEVLVQKTIADRVVERLGERLKTMSLEERAHARGLLRLQQQGRLDEYFASLFSGKGNASIDKSMILEISAMLGIDAVTGLSHPIVYKEKISPENQVSFDVENFAKKMLNLKTLVPMDTSDLDDCPYTLYEITYAADNITDSTEAESAVFLQVFHKGAKAGYRIVSANGSGQQCTYDSNGNLIISGSAAGTPDLVSPATPNSQNIVVKYVGLGINLIRHSFEDVIPTFSLSEEEYHQIRPINQGASY